MATGHIRNLRRLAPRVSPGSIRHLSSLPRGSRHFRAALDAALAFRSATSVGSYAWNRGRLRRGVRDDWGRPRHAPPRSVGGGSLGHLDRAFDGSDWRVRAAFGEPCDCWFHCADLLVHRPRMGTVDGDGSRGTGTDRARSAYRGDHGRDVLRLASGGWAAYETSRHHRPPLAASAASWILSSSRRRMVCGRRARVLGAVRGPAAPRPPSWLVAASRNPGSVVRRCDRNHPPEHA